MENCQPKADPPGAETRLILLSGYGELNSSYKTPSLAYYRYTIPRLRHSSASAGKPAKVKEDGLLLLA